MTGPTLRQIQQRHMQIEAHCGSARCGRSYIADLERLVSQFGPLTLLSELPKQTCDACETTLRLVIAPQDREDDWDDDGDTDPMDDGRDDRHWD